MRALFITATFSFALLTGCAINRPLDPQAAMCALPIEPIGVVISPDRAPRRQMMRSAMSDIAATKLTNPIVRSLVLSGGGQHGSFGSGFLNGLQDAGQMHRYDIVTGVSTGALQSTFAFLGTTTAPVDRILQAADDFPQSATVPTRTNVNDTISGYTISREATLYIDKGSAGMVRRAAKGSLSPLVTRLNKMITPETLRAVGAANAQNRKLYVALLNYDSGGAEVVDMTALAARYDGSNFARIQYCYNQVLLASSSEPLGAPPVSIDGNLYMDAAIRYAVFLKDVFASSAIASSAAEFHTDIVVNDNLTVDPNDRGKQKINILDIMGRARLILVNQIYLFSVSDIINTRPPGHKVRFAAIRPSETAIAPPAKGATFDPVYMKRMIALGRKRGARGDWQALSEMAVMAGAE